MTGGIQIFRYEYAPSIATVREKVGNKIVMKRPVSKIHEYNKNNLTKLKTTIEHVETFENGAMGRAKFQYIEKEKTSDGNRDYADFEIWYQFYINKDLKILIIGGDSIFRNQVKNEIVRCFNGDIGHAQEMTILKDDLLALVNKIKTHGPKKDGEYRNMMKKCMYDHPDLSSHGGAEGESVKMHDSAEPICVSKSDSYIRNFPDCETFHTMMRIFKCGGILPELSTKEYKLLLKSTAEFSTGLNPAFEQWIHFVIQVCKSPLHLG